MDAPTKQAAADRAYRVLERLLVTLQLVPGSVTTETALIERVGLGRTPVREALQRLAWEGLVEIRPRAGIAVAPLFAADWLRIVEVRHDVEVILARAAARFVTNEAAALFHDAALAMQKSVITGNVVAFLEADKAMDEAMAASADNPFAARVAAPLQTHSRRFWFRYQNDSGLAEAARRHVDIIGAVTNGDEHGAGEAAARLMDLLRVNAEAAARI